MKKLLVVESPTKAKTLKKYLPKDFEVLACVGHIKNLPKSKLGVDLDAGFAPEYKLISGKKKIVDEIVAKAKQCNMVYLGPDPDREGEAIAFHVSEEITKKIKSTKIFRVLMHEITKKGLERALATPSKIDLKRYESQQARRVLDRIVGYLISPLLWERVKRGTSAGRVQSVALRLAVERERQIKEFVSKPYFKGFGSFEVNKECIVSELTQLGGQKYVPKESDISQAELEETLSGFQKDSWHVSDVSSRQRQKVPPHPFITSSLQMEASSKLRFSPKKTMVLAQQLYEGLELGPLGLQGLITYMRTDSTRIAEDIKEDVGSWIQKTWGPSYGAKQSLSSKKKKGVQDAHEAIRPADFRLTPEKVKPYLERDLFSLYQLIWKRFVASQMAPAVFKHWQVLFSNTSKQDVFTHTKQQLVFDGFRVVLDDPEESDAFDPKFYESIAIESHAKLLETQVTSHKTEPPPRFSEASLIKELEQKGIGRPSTYASIMSTILERQYVEKVQSRIIPTALGSVISDLLTKHFSHIVDYDFTAQMEDSLDKIESGEALRKDILSEFYENFIRVLEKAKEEMKNLKAQEIPTDIVCDECGQHMNIRWGKTGEFLSCSAYPKCRNAKNFVRDEQGQVIVQAPKIHDKPCPKCGKSLVERFGRYGRYLACQDYPEPCKTTLPFPIGVSCPVCSKGSIVERKSKRGRLFFACDQYPDCDFASWQRPTSTPCPSCQHPFLVEKETKKLGLHRACPKCKYTEPIDEGESKSRGENNHSN